jgi:uroporphyrinogen decarboxylase
MLADRRVAGEVASAVGSPMNGYERFMTAAGRGKPDRVPLWELIINRPVIQALHPELFTPGRTARYERGSQGGFLLQADFVEEEDLDGITVFEDGTEHWLDDVTFRDEWGITWQVAPSGIPYAVRHPIETASDLDDFHAPDPEAAHRLKSLEAAVERFKGKRAVVFLGHDAFEFSHYLRGMDNLLMDYVLDPDTVLRLARIVMDYKRRVLERAAEAGADVLATGDDYAHNRAPMMSPEHFERFVLPYLREAVEVAKAAGLPFLKHTDGYLWPILDMIVDAGIDILDPVEPTAGMDIGRVSERYGDRIALAGNVDCSHLLPHGTTQEVVEAVKETLAKGGADGGLILASSNSIHPAVKPENYQAMVDAARAYGRYPLDPDMVNEYRQRDYAARFRQTVP